MTRRLASVLSIVVLLGVAGCSNTWDGFQKDMDDTQDEVGEELDDV
jgi:predicted small secreted protein